MMSTSTKGNYENATTQNTLINPGSKITTMKLNNGNFLLCDLKFFQCLKAMVLKDRLIKIQKHHRSIYRQPVEGTYTIVKSNLEFTIWNLQDRLIVSWLPGSIAKGILADLLYCTTTKEI